MTQPYVNTRKMGYLPYINIARCLGMFFVLIGHISPQENVVNTVYSFHMPLFFFLSGMVFKKDSEMGGYIRKKAVALLVPYVVFYLLTLIYYWVVESHFRNVQIDQELNRLIPIFYGSDLRGYMSHNVPLWFLPALFCTEVIYNFLSLKIKSNLVKCCIVVSLSLIGYGLSFIGVWSLPWGLSPALLMLPFFMLGSLMANLLNEHKLTNRNSKIGVSILFLVILSIFIMNKPWNIRFDVAYGNIDNLPIFAISALIGICLVIIFSLLIEKNRILEFLGKGDVTLVALCIQGVVYRPIIYVFYKLLGREINVIETIIISILTYLLAVLVSAIYYRFIKCCKQIICEGGGRSLYPTYSSTAIMPIK